MNEYQKWYLIGLYFYINIYITIQFILKKQPKIVFWLLLLWSLPFLGYIVVVIFLTKNKELIKFKDSKLLEFKTTLKTVKYSGLLLSIFIYFLIYLFLG